MTPQLQQAIKLLQITRAELLELVAEALKANPIIEEAAPESEQQDILSANLDPSQPTAKDSEKPHEENSKISETLQKIISDNRDDFTVYGSPDKFFKGSPDIKGQVSLYENLICQLSQGEFSEEEKQIGTLIIGNIDENGYLGTPLEELAESSDYKLSEIENVLKKIHQFEPAGIGARDMKECLLIQLHNKGLHNSLIEDILNGYMKEIEAKKFKIIAKKLKIKEELVMDALKIIMTLDPKPGRSLSSIEPPTIIPDVIVKKIDNEYHTFLNEEGTPHLKINRYYSNLTAKTDIKPEVRNYINDRMRSAIWLIGGIHKRNQSILIVARSIVKYQHEFLDKGIEYLKPLILREIAYNVNLHESTVSRACTGKYMDTPQGIFEMKYFFSSSIHTSDRGNVSSELLKTKIANIISMENHMVPFTDEKIMEELKKIGFNIARRTVVKYREKLGIHPARERKKIG